MDAHEMINKDVRIHRFSQLAKNSLNSHKVPPPFPVILAIFTPLTSRKGFLIKLYVAKL